MSATPYLTPNQLDAIRDAVRSQSKAYGIKQQTIYAAIRREFNARTYYHVSADRFEDILKVIRSYGIPQPEPAKATAQVPSGAAAPAGDAPAVFEVVRSDLLFTFEGTKDLRTMRAQLLTLQRRLQKLLDEGLGLLDDIETITGVSPFAR